MGEGDRDLGREAKKDPERSDNDLERGNRDPETETLRGVRVPESGGQRPRERGEQRPRRAGGPAAPVVTY